MRKKAFHNPTHAYMAGKLMPKSELILKTTATHTQKTRKIICYGDDGDNDHDEIRLDRIPMTKMLIN